jgi:hypothetical protein
MLSSYTIEEYSALRVFSDIIRILFAFLMIDTNRSRDPPDWSSSVAGVGSCQVKIIERVRVVFEDGLDDQEGLVSACGPTGSISWLRASEGLAYVISP